MSAWPADRHQPPTITHPLPGGDEVIKSAVGAPHVAASPSLPARSRTAPPRAGRVRSVSCPCDADLPRGGAGTVPGLFLAGSAVVAIVGPFLAGPSAFTVALSLAVLAGLAEVVAP